MKILISFLIALFIHVAFIFAGKVVYKPPTVFFDPGESAIEMKLVSSKENLENKKSTISKINKEVSEIKEVSSEKLEEVIEPNPIEQIDEFVDIPESLIKTTQEKEEQLVEDIPVAKVQVEKREQNPIKTEKLEEPIEKIIEEPVEELSESKSQLDSMPSTEIIADLFEKGIIAPLVDGVKKPKYPLSCRNKGHEGVCVLKAIIDSSGECIDVEIVESAGCIKLDKSAIKVLKKAKFKPAEQFGINVNGSKKMSFKFRIKDLD